MDLTSLLVHPATAWVFATALVSVSLIAAKRWHRIAARAVTQLSLATETLERVHGQAAFEQNRQQIVADVSAHFNAVPSWRRAWERCHQSFQIMERADGAKVVAGEYSPGEFFHAGVLYRDHSMHWFRGLSNYLVGMGLCFTFLGIIIVIRHAADSLGSESDAATQSLALRQLLSATSLKFVTSLCGVFCSIAYSIFFRAKCAAIDCALDSFCYALGSRIFLLNPATLLQMNLQQARRQSASLGTLASNIAVGIGEKLTVVSDQQQRALAKLEGKLDAATEQAVANTESIVAAVRELKERVGQVNDETMSRLVEATLKSLDSALQLSLQRISCTLAEVGEQFEEVRLGFTEINSTVGDLKVGYSEIGEEVRTRAEEISDLLLKAEAEVENHLERASQAAGDLRETFTTIFNEADPIKKVSLSLADTVRDLRDAGNGWGGLVQTIAQSVSTTADASVKTQAAAESLDKSWQAQASRLNEIDTHLASTIRAVQAHFDAYAESLRDFTSELDTGMAGALDMFGATIQSLGDAPDRFSAAATAMHQTALDASKALEPLRELRELAAAMNEASRSLSAAVIVARAVPAPLEMPPRA